MGQKRQGSQPPEQRLQGQPSLQPEGSPRRRGRPKAIPPEDLDPLRHDITVTIRRVKTLPFLGRAPRGRTARANRLTAFLKERVPLVYAYVVRELRSSAGQRDPRLARVIAAWRCDVGRRSLPSARELTAYIVEQALHGAWEVYGVRAPFHEAELDAFFRRYVHGHPGALRAFRAALNLPKPWACNHVGHELEYFLGEPGTAARHYGFLKWKPSLEFAVMQFQGRKRTRDAPT